MILQQSDTHGHKQDKLPCSTKTNKSMCVCVRVCACVCVHVQNCSAVTHFFRYGRVLQNLVPPHDPQRCCEVLMRALEGEKCGEKPPASPESVNVWTHHSLARRRRWDSLCVRYTAGPAGDTRSCFHTGTGRGGIPSLSPWWPAALRDT